MKVTLITSPFGYLPPNGFGAVEKLWYNIGKNIANKGHDVTIIAKNYSSTESNSTQTKDNFKLKFINGFFRTGSLKKDIFLDLIYSFRALRLMDKSDVLVMNTFGAPLICFLFRNKFRISVYNVQRFPKGQFRFFKHIDRLSCVSSSVYNELYRQTPSAICKANIIGNPVDITIFKPDPDSNNDTEKTKNQIQITYTGRIHPEKGIELLVSACNILINEGINIGLNLVGPRSIAEGGGGEFYIEKLNGLATNYKVNWVEPISNPILLRNQLLKADIYCYPSIAAKGETFGVAPLEAMATGVPTIVSNLDCFKDFVNDNINGLIFDHTSKDAVIILKNKIKQLIDSPSLRRKLASEGVETSKKFSDQIIAEKYLQDFIELLNQK